MAQAEIAIAMFNSPNPLGARVGDVVVARKPLGRIGKVESRLYVWLIISDLEPDERELISRPQYSSDDELILVRKNRFNAPTDKIRRRIKDFDLLRGMDKNQIYQPGLLLDEKTGKFPVGSRGFTAVDLLIDKNDDSIFIPKNPRRR